MLWRVACGRGLELRLREAAVNFQVSSNNEMHTVNVKQHPSTGNPPQLGNNEWLSLRPQLTPVNKEISMQLNYFSGTSCLFPVFALAVSSLTQKEYTKYRIALQFSSKDQTL